MKIFFDVDGVLIDGWHSNSTRRKPWDATIAQDLGIDQKAFQTRFFACSAGRFDSPMHDCVRGERDLKDALADVLPSVGYTGSTDAFVKYWFEKDSNVNAAVLEVVKRLVRHKHLNLYIATGQEHYRAAYLWNELGFSRYFADIFYSAKLRRLKGTPEFFDTVNTLLDITADERPIFFDDQEDVVELARAAGWDACVFSAVEDMREHPSLRALLQ